MFQISALAKHTHFNKKVVIFIHSAILPLCGISLERTFSDLLYGISHVPIGEIE